VSETADFNLNTTTSFAYIFGCCVRPSHEIEGGNQKKRKSFFVIIMHKAFPAGHPSSSKPCSREFFKNLRKENNNNHKQEHHLKI